MATRRSVVLFCFLNIFGILAKISAQSRCPQVPDLPQIVGVLTTGGRNGHPVKITVNIRSRLTLNLEWYRSVSVKQAYNHTALYRVPIKHDASMYTIVKTKRASTHHTSLAFSQPNTQQTTDFSLYHLIIEIMDECFQYKLTVTPPIGGANGAGIAMPRLLSMGRRTTMGSLEFQLRPHIPAQVMAAIGSGRAQGPNSEQILFLDMTPWKRQFERNGRELDWNGPNAMSEEVRRVLRYGGYPTGPYTSSRPRSVTDPGLYMVTFTQMFMGKRLELTVFSEVTHTREGRPPSVGLATCGIYKWRNSTFGNVIPLKPGEQNCVRCVASGVSPLRLTFAKQLIRSEGVQAGYRRLKVDDVNRLGESYASLRYNVIAPSESDKGWYVCGATNRYGTTTRTFRLEVIDPVRIAEVEPSTLILRQNGQIVTMKCTACGSPSVNFTFFRMNFDLVGRYQEEPASALRYRAYPLEGGRGNPPINTMTTTRRGPCVTTELEHRVRQLRYYRQGEKFACVAKNCFGDYRVGLADIKWEINPPGV